MAGCERREPGLDHATLGSGSDAADPLPILITAATPGGKHDVVAAARPSGDYVGLAGASPAAFPCFCSQYARASSLIPKGHGLGPID